MPKKNLDNGSAKVIKKNVNSSKHKLPVPFPNGTILTDITKRQWRLGKSIGVGGFGEIYLASDNVTKSVGNDATFVIKIEPHSNGPLFTEIHCLYRIGKIDFSKLDFLVLQIFVLLVEAWKKEHKLSSLGMPALIGSGSIIHCGEKYRFMVMERYGEDLHKIFERHGKKLSVPMVFSIGIKVLNILEYIHAHGYIHADIKGSNLLLDCHKKNESEVFLIDYGLACRYQNQGLHKEYKPDLRFAHDGTIEYTSRDAHTGAHSRRGDLEILGYNMLQWLSGHLPWESCLNNPESVHTSKKNFMSDINNSFKKLFGSNLPPGVIFLQSYLQYVKNLNFDSRPDYEHLRQLLHNGIKKQKCVMGQVSSLSETKTRKKRHKHEEENENLHISEKRIKSSSRSRKPLKSVRNVHCMPSSNKIDKSYKSPQNEISSPTEIYTPAMLEVIQKKISSVSQESQDNPYISNSSLHSKTNNLTPAMQMVLEKRCQRQKITESTDKSKESELLKKRAQMVKRKYVRKSLFNSGRLSRKSMCTQTSPGLRPRPLRRKHTYSPELM